MDSFCLEKHATEMHSVKLNPSQITSEDINFSNVYALLVANCGGVDTGLQLAGTLAIKSPWGLLPVTEFYKKNTYLVMTLVYAGLALLWLGLTYRWWAQLRIFQ